MNKLNIVDVFPLLSMFLTFMFIIFAYFYCNKYIIRCKIFPQTTIPNKLRFEYYDDFSKYVKSNNAKEILQNKFLTIYMNDYGDNAVIRVLNKKNHKMFEIYTDLEKLKNDEQIATIYGIIQMYFTNNITYGGIKDWCEHRGHTLIKEIYFPIE